MKNTILKLFLFVSFYFLYLTPVSAAPFMNNDQLKNLNFLGSPSEPEIGLIYKFNRAIEEFKLKYLLKEPQSKAKFMSQVLEKRFQELVYVINNKDENMVETSVMRYNSWAGKIIGDYKGVDTNLKQQTASYSAILEKLRTYYPGDTSFTRFIQEAADTSKRLD